MSKTLAFGILYCLKNPEVMTKVQNAKNQRSWQRYRRQIERGHGKDKEGK